MGLKTSNVFDQFNVSPGETLALQHPPDKSGSNLDVSSKQLEPNLCA